MHVCTGCFAEFNDPKESAFVIVMLSDGADGPQLEASAWDALIDRLHDSVGQNVLLKVTPRNDNAEAVSIDHLQIHDSEE